MLRGCWRGRCSSRESFGTRRRQARLTHAECSQTWAKPAVGIAGALCQ